MPNNLFDPRITQPLPRSKIDVVAGWVGLGGIRERWTNGELGWWMMSAAFLSSGLTLLVVMAATN
jgi:hypothetical protein